MIPWDPDSESRINYGAYLGQFGLVMVFVHCLVFNEIVHNISTGKLSIPESAIVKKSHHKSNTAVWIFSFSLQTQGWNVVKVEMCFAVIESLVF